MSRSGQLRVAKTRTIPEPNDYILALHGEFAPWCFDEEAAPKMCGQWREAAFQVPASAPVDLEIGTGNGLHFAHRAVSHPDRCLLGIELKYKPLIQSIRRVRRAGMSNARVLRYNAYLLRELFKPGELNDVFIFFPDPWEKLRQHKHRIIHDEFLSRLHETQAPGSHLYFKTDSRDYFDWSMTRFRRSAYRLVDYTYDLYSSPLTEGNFATQFEQLFVRQGIAIGYARLARD